MILYLDNRRRWGRGSTAATLRAPQSRPRARAQRESRARDPRAAHARRRRRLQPSRRHGIREGADGLVDRRRDRPGAGGLGRRPRPTVRASPRLARAAFAGGDPASSISAPLMHEPGDKTVLGQALQASAASRKARRCCATLALHPAHRAASRDEARAAFRRRRSAGEARRAARRTSICGTTASSRASIAH